MEQAINKNKKNIFKILSPYFLMRKGGDELSVDEREKMVIFFGANYKDLPGADWDKFAEITNQSLDFIRRECPGCKIFYKPHPAETDELSALNMDGVELIKDSSIAEFFLWKNASRIKSVFSVCSMASASAHRMGFNAYIFRGLLKQAVDAKTFKGYGDCFKGLPDGFFIDNPAQKIAENKKMPQRDHLLESELKKLAMERSGRIWFLIGDPNFLVEVMLMTDLMRSANPLKKVNLAIMEHHRWQVMNPDDFKSHFDEICFFPRIFYSLRPQKILNALKTARSAKSFDMKADDIFIGLTFTSFVENCLISFHEPKMKIAILPQSTFDFCCGATEPDKRNYFRRKSIFLWNEFIEPILGLNKSVFMEDRRRIRNFSRYRKPLNDLYDKVFLLQTY